MPGDWIQMDTELENKAETLRIADQTGEEIPTICGRLFIFWCWVDRQFTGPKLEGPGIKSLCRKFGGDETFWLAVQDVGWVKIHDNAIEVPGWEKRFSKSARRRIEEAARKRKSRGSVPPDGIACDNKQAQSGQSADALRTECGQAADEKRHTEPEPEPEPESKNPVSSNRGSVFSNLDSGTLRDDQRLLAWCEQARNCRKSVIGPAEADLLNVFAAAEAALEDAKGDPVILFKHIVGKKDYSKITEGQDARGHQRLKNAEAAAMPPLSAVATDALSKLKPSLTAQP